MGKRTGRRPSRVEVDPFDVLGLARDATLDQIESARRALAKSVHPDVGGSVIEMQRINAAADEAAMLIVARQAPGSPPSPRSSAPAPPTPAESPVQVSMAWQFDHPSFTVEALPVATFEALLVVASWLGETIDDDPPYRLDVELVEPFRSWCRLDLVPDAGATTVSLTVGTELGVGKLGLVEPDIDRVRDTWIDALNALDWAVIGDSPQQP